MKLRAAAAALLVVLTGCSGGDAKPKRQREANRPSMGFIDMPVAQSTVGPIFTVSGWVIDESLVDKVRIYLDDELVATVGVEIMRPDVDQAFPNRAQQGKPHGYLAIIDAGTRAGYCTIRTEAIDGRGGMTQFATTSVKIEP
jgi:hypothetical protein